MRRFWAMTAAVAITAIVAAGCDVNAEFSSPVVVDNISIKPEDWKVMLNAGQFDYFYFDVRLHEINEAVFKTGNFQTYWKFGELREGVAVDVQEPLPAIMNLSRFSNEQGRWIPYTETLSCNYDVGRVRIMLSRSDFFSGLPANTLYFRTVVGW